MDGTSVAAVLTAPGEYEVREYPIGDLVEPGEAIVRVNLCGICGTDKHTYQGYTPGYRILRSEPRLLPFELVICDRLLAEVRTVLTERPRLRKWISLEAAELYSTTLATVADVQPDPASRPALTRDSDDDYVIHLARAHDVDPIVSSDADLLEWDEQDPPVIPPAGFEARLRQS